MFQYFNNISIRGKLTFIVAGAQILISHAVKAELGAEAALKPLPAISLKGFSAPVPVFQARSI